MGPVMRKSRNPNERDRIWRGVGGFAAAAAVMLLLADASAAQDSTVYVGGSGKPEVQVDLGAIYGGGYERRRLLMPNSDLTGPVQLRPPGASEKLTLQRPGAPAKPGRPPAPSPESMAAKPPASVTTPPTPPKAPKMAAEPPPPKTKKRLPVKTEPLPPEGDTAAAPEPPPAPPAPPEGGETAAPAKTAKATAEDIKEKTDSAMAPPPPPPPADGMAADSADIPPPPPPPPAPEDMAAAETAPPAQVAAIPPEKAVTNGTATPVAFSAGSAVLEDSAKETLAAVAKTMTGDGDLRLQIVAYAVGEDDNASQARRLSLSRALAVRSYLIDQGIRSTRMDVRALGNKFESGPGDRVDLVIVNQ